MSFQLNSPLNSYRASLSSPDWNSLNSTSHILRVGIIEANLCGMQQVSFEILNALTLINNNDFNFKYIKCTSQ